MISFPISPTVGDTYSYNGNTWIWNGNAWDKVIGISNSWAFVSFVFLPGILPQIDGQFVQLTYI